MPKVGMPREPVGCRRPSSFAAGWRSEIFQEIQVRWRNDSQKATKKKSQKKNVLESKDLEKTGVSLTKNTEFLEIYKIFRYLGRSHPFPPSRTRTPWGLRQSHRSRAVWVRKSPKSISTFMVRYVHNQISMSICLVFQDLFWSAP